MKTQNLLAIAALVSVPALCLAQEATQTNVPFTDTLAKNQAAVVSIKATGSVTMSMEGREGEQDEFEEEASAIVVSEAGLVVTSLSTVDPSSAYDDLPDMGEDMPDFKVTAEIKSINVRFNDTKEVAYEVAIRDKDLGIAVLKPKTPQTGQTFIDLANAGDAAVLDNVLLVSRLGKGANWVTSARVEMVTSLFTKPRKMYHIPFSVAGEDSDIGSAAFTRDGKFLGMQTYFVMSGGEDYYLVALPAKELAAVVAQVK